MSNLEIYEKACKECGHVGVAGKSGLCLSCLHKIVVKEAKRRLRDVALPTETDD